MRSHPQLFTALLNLPHAVPRHEKRIEEHFLWRWHLGTVQAATFVELEKLTIKAGATLTSHLACSSGHFFLDNVRQFARLCDVASSSTAGLDNQSGGT